MMRRKRRMPKRRMRNQLRKKNPKRTIPLLEMPRLKIYETIFCWSRCLD